MSSRTRPTASSAPKKSPAANTRGLSPPAGAALAPLDGQSAPLDGQSAPAANPADASAQIPLPRGRYVTFFGLALLGCGADLLSKELVFRWRGLPEGQPTWWLIENYLGVQTSLNPGALFGMGAGGSWFFATLSAVAVVGILVWLFVWRAAHDRLLNFALGCMTGGILGNLYDRLGLWHLGRPLPPGFNGLDHAVRDWILFQCQEIPLKIFNPWPNFNIADSLLVCSAGLLVFHAWRYREPAPSSKDVV